MKTECPDQPQALEDIYSLDDQQVQALLDENMALASRVESELEDLNKLVERSAAAQKEVAAKIRLYQSLIAPIRRLPFEIVGMIFIEYLEGAEHPSHHVISLVCHHWKNVLLKTPAAWSKISLHPNNKKSMLTPEAVLARHVSRAGRSPLAIEVTTTVGRGSNWFPVYPALNAIVLRAGDTPWRSFSFESGTYTGVKGLEPSLPVFRHLSTSTSIKTMTKLNLSIRYARVGFVVGRTFKDTFGDAMTKAVALDELCIPEQLLAPSHPIFKTIKHLTLYNTFHSPSISGAIEFARECTALESLTSDTWCSCRVPENLPVFTIPTLKYLSLEEKKSPLIFVKMRVPNLHTLVIKESDGTRGGELMALFEELVKQPSGPPPVKKLVMDTPCAEKTLIWILEHFPTLEELHISNLSRMSEKTIEALKREATTRRAWICPKLKVLKITNCRKVSRSLLPSLLRIRREAAERPVPNTKSKCKYPERLLPPVALESVWFDGSEVLEADEVQTNIVEV